MYLVTRTCEILFPVYLGKCYYTQPILKKCCDYQEALAFKTLSINVKRIGICQKFTPRRKKPERPLGRKRNDKHVTPTPYTRSKS